MAKQLEWQDLRVEGKHVIVKRVGSDYVLKGAYNTKDEAIAFLDGLKLSQRARHKYFGPFKKVKSSDFYKGYSHNPCVAYPGSFNKESNEMFLG